MLSFFGIFVLAIAGYFLLDEFLNKGPDLIVEDVYLEDGELVIIQKNNGRTNIPSVTSGRTDIYVDDLSAVAFSSLWSGLDSLEFLDAGNATQLVPTNFLDGTHIVKVCIDASFLVDESREENNCLEKRVGDPKVSIELNMKSGGNLVLNGKDQELLSFSITAYDDLVISHLPIGFSASNDNHDTNAGLLDENGNANFTNIRLMDVESGEVFFGPIDSKDLKTELNGDVFVDENTDASSTAFYIFVEPFGMIDGQKLELALVYDQRNNPIMENTAIAANLQLGLEYPKILTSHLADNSEHLLPHEPLFGDIKAIGTR